MPPIGTDETLRITKLLNQRFTRSQYPGLITVGLATAEKEGDFDPSRPCSVCFYVAKKKLPEEVPVGQQFPKTVRIGMYIDGVLKYYDLKTDVYGLETARATARLLQSWPEPDSKGKVSAGVVIEWKKQAVTQLGLLTVGHSFFDGQEYWDPGVPDPVTKRVTLHSNEHQIVGEFLVKIPHTSPSTFIPDLGVVQLAVPLAKVIPSKAKLISTNFEDIPSFQDISFYPLTEGANLQASTGYSLQDPSGLGKVNFVVNGYLNKCILFLDDAGERILPVRHVVRVKSNTTNAFGPGSSGTPWVIELPGGTGGKTPKLFAMQIGEDYTTGFGLLFSDPLGIGTPYFGPAMSKLSSLVQGEISLNSYF
jgi:hypothetical protein